MKKILITGATDGIGLETAKQLAKLGHHLLIHGRSDEKLASTKLLLEALVSNVVVETYQADLSSFKEVEQLINEITSKHQRLDIIINNAGVFKVANPKTESGIDVRFVVNTISPYMLTKGLLPLLVDDGRVVNLSSAAQAPVNFDALQGKVAISDDFQAYAQSKLALTIWSQALATNLKPMQVMVAVNPGSLLASKMVKEGFGVAGNDLGIGADILIRAALADDFISSNGKYFDNDAKQFASPHADSKNIEKCDELMKILDCLSY